MSTRKMTARNNNSTTKSIIIKRMSRFALAVSTSLIAISLSPVTAFAEQSTDSEPKVESKEGSSGRKEASAEGQKERELQVLTLDDIRDVGLALYVVKQQVLNIYAEAIRNRADTESSPEIIVNTAIPVDTRHLKVLPLRREWLAVYLASMEPVVRLLAKEVTEAQTGVKALVIPESIHKEIDPLWQAWSRDITKINEHLDELMPLLDDAPHNNSKVAQVAVCIHDDVERLEKLRKQIFEFVKKTQKDPNAKIRYEE